MLLACLVIRGLPSSGGGLFRSVAGNVDFLVDQRQHELELVWGMNGKKRLELHLSFGFGGCGWGSVAVQRAPARQSDVTGRPNGGAETDRASADKEALIARWGSCTLGRVCFHGGTFLLSGPRIENGFLSLLAAGAVVCSVRSGPTVTLLSPPHSRPPL